MPIQSKGRMLRRDISKSDKLADLSKESLILFFMIIPHLNSFGKANGSPYFIKGEIVPKLKYFDVNKIESCLKEIDAKTNLKWFEDGGLMYLHSVSWDEHQELREDRLGNDSLPDYSRTTPGVLHLEVKDKAQDKDKGKSEERFKEILAKYPNKVQHKKAFLYFLKTVKTDEDWASIQTALVNYLALKRVADGFVQNCSTWFNNWTDWINVGGAEKPTQDNPFPNSKPLQYYKPDGR